MGIKAHYLQDKNHERFYPYAHAVATFDRDGVTVQKRLDDIDTTIDNINTNIEELDIQSDWDEDDTSNKAYIKNKPTSMPASDVPAWAKEPTKPSYTWSEINSKPSTFPPSAHDHENATSSTDGFLSYIDKNKLDSIEEGATKTVIDSALSSSSTNPVQNKVVNNALAGKVPTSRTINGKALTANITLSASDVNAIPTSQKGSANGVATLDQNGLIPTSQLPASVDEIIEGYLSGGKFYKESEHLNEITGEASKIYVDITAGQNLTYRWSGTAYVEISKSLALGETSGTAYRGDRGKIAYDHSQSAHARSDATKTEDSSTNGNIKINGSEVNVYTHPSYTSKSSGLYKITVDSTGHVSGATAVSKSDITALGIPGQDTNTTYNNATTSTDGLMSSEDKAKLDGIASGANKYVHPSYTVKASGLYKVTVDATGHVSATTAVTKSDITALGIPAQDTNTTYSAFKGATASAAGGTGLVPAPATGYQARFLRGDGTWATPTNTTYAVMTGATSSAAGKSGLVPAPSAGSATRYLRSDGTWVVPPNTTYSVATSSANGLMSASDKAKLDGIASGANKYTHPAYTAKSSGLYKVTVDSTGHVSATAAVTKSDITALGIPGSDTNTWTAFKGASSSAAGTAGYVPAPSAGSANRYFRSDGTWAVPPDTNTNTTYTLSKSGSTITLTGSDGSKTSVTDANTTYTLSSFGVTASAAELNKLDGAVVSVGEINYLDGVTSSIQNQLNTKAGLVSDKTDLKAGDDLNDFDTIGTYRSASGTISAEIANIPSGTSGAGFLLWVVSMYGKEAGFSGTVLQIFMGGASANTPIWIRRGGAGAWSAWQEVYTSTNKPTPAEIGAATSSHTHSNATTSAAGFLPKLGGGTTNYLRADGTWAKPPDTNTNTTYTLTKSGSTITLTGSDGKKTSVTDSNTTYSLSSFGITATAAELNKLDGVTATAAELNYVDGVTSNIQTQLNGKAASSHTHTATQVSGLTASRALVSNSSGQVAVSAVTSTELSYLDGVTSAIQTQLNGKAATSHTHNYAGSSSAGGSANSVKGTLTIQTNGSTKASFNGSASATVNITASSIGAAASSHSHSYLPLGGGTMTGNITFNTTSNNGSWIQGKTRALIMISPASPTDGSAYHPIMMGKTTAGDVWNLGHGPSDEVGFFGYYSERTANGTDWAHYIKVSDGTVHFGKTVYGTFSGSLSGNASTATTATTATTANKTAGTLTVQFNGTTNKTFNGSSSQTVNITPSAIGAAASSHSHNYAGSSSAGGAANSVKGALTISLNGTSQGAYNGSAAKSINITASSVGAAASSHNHSAANITSGTLAVARGGTGITSNPSLLVNLGSTSAASVFATSPRPGITGTLAVSHGGTGSTSAAGARSSLGATQVKGQSSEPSQNTGDVWLRWV